MYAAFLLPLAGAAIAALALNPPGRGAGPVAATVHIADLDDEMGGSGGPREIEGRVGIWVHDAEHRAAGGVIVRAAWSGAVTGTTRCTTDQQGYCQMLSKPLVNEQGIYLVMTVRGYDNPEFDFDKNANHEPDGDSDGTRIRIQR